MKSWTTRLFLATLLLPAVASAQQIKTRLMVLLDTSGSMGFHLSNNNDAGGDGSTSYTGPQGSIVPNWSGQNAYPINIYPGRPLGGNLRDGVNSRLFNAKSVLTDAINAYTGDIDFGLAVYDFQFCPYNTPLCHACVVNFGQDCWYTNNAGNAWVSMNWRYQGCGGPGQGGSIITAPVAGSNAKILPWVDGIENYQDSGDGVTAYGTTSTPQNPELRASGDTPLAEAIATVKAGWYQPIFNAAPNAPLYDDKLNCRPYIMVVETDGVQSYECRFGVRGGAPGPGNPCCNGEHCNNGVCGADPVTAVQNLYNVNNANPVQVYVIGLSIQNQGDIAQLNAMAAAGGTTTARLANNQAEIAAAYADIVAKSVKVEQCNAKDDNCNALVDEGLGVYQECKSNNQCGSGTCNGGRCTCARDADCANSYSCSGGFCQPSCSVGVGACLRAGAKKCDAKGNATCCNNDGLAACTPLVAGNPGPPICKPGVDNNCNGILDVNEVVCQMNPCAPLPEVCNGIDDDCDSVIDNNLTDTGKSCGLTLGICKAGVTTCVNSNNVDVLAGGTADKGDRLICKGEVKPQPAQCNGCDNTCVGVVDAPTQSCYAGPPGTEGKGICRAGSQRCVAVMCPQAPAYGPCVGQVLPGVEVCNGLDDDCNGKIDDVPGAGVACCPSNKCGVGICVAGSTQCSGGNLACGGGQGPLAETCNGLDDDCNGMVDDLPNLGQPCAAPNGCPGTLKCDAQKKMVVCDPGQQMNCLPMGCGGDPRLGQPCGPGVGLPAPCMAGTWTCVNEQVTCVGGRGPSTETCNCLDDDCNGKVDEDAFCPGGTACVKCSCAPPCGAGEFKCPASFDCIDDGAPCQTSAECPPAQVCFDATRKCSGYCVPLCNPPCLGDSMCKSGVCVDPCKDVMCKAGEACQKGNCIDVTCRANPSLCKACEDGAGGERCNVTLPVPACEPDKCCGKACDTGTICDPATGGCLGTCATVTCGPTQLCRNGVCSEDKCDNKSCPGGVQCNPATGNCEQNACTELKNTCIKQALVCCQNACQTDPCSSVVCPIGSRCRVDEWTCTPDCLVPIVDPAQRDQIMSSGGGGLAFGCSVAPAGARTAEGGAGLWILAAGLLALGGRRRRWRWLRPAAGVRRLPIAALLVATATLGAGCTANPLCLNCLSTDDSGATRRDLGGATDSSSPDDMVSLYQDLGDLACSPNLQSDPNNCGSCGHVCQFPQAGGLCVNSMCVLGQCLQGWYDTDKDPKNGCETNCIPTAPAKCKVDGDCPFALPCVSGLCAKPCKADTDCPARTVCDPNTSICEGEFCDGVDNNCNAKIDEGFDLQSDLANCGACNATCNPPNATPSCQMGKCTIVSCAPDGKGGRWHDANKSLVDGCEYDCGVEPPRLETCNNLDDDCDGVIDNNLTDVGKACDDYCPALAACKGQGNCAFPLSACKGACCGVCTEGTGACAGGKKICLPGRGPSLETCNGLDDNCDGQIDEGYNLKTDILNCNACGHNCGASVNGGDGNAVWQCNMGVCAIAACKPGFGDVDKNIANGCEYACPVNPPAPESCNGKDDDCSGAVDDNLVMPANFCAQQSLCVGAKPVCCGAAGWLCNYPSVNAKIEVTDVQMVCQGGNKGGNIAFSETLCDGIDGNCNGMTDESFLNLGKACSVGVGACQAQASFVCDPKNPKQTTCPTAAVPTNATDEQCNGLDDNCDGQVDERTPMNGFTCYTNGANAHACAGWIDPAVQVGNVWVHAYEASRVDATANAIGNSSTRACAKAGTLPWTSVTQAQAAAACAAIKDSTGAALRLCTAAEWSTACSLGGAGTWSFAANPNMYQAGVCNGFDANFGISWATGTGVSCYANQAKGKIFDMSGNVGEWTGTAVVANGSTYYKARGGTYSDFSGGLKCDFDFVLLQPGFANVDIGFRCCADHAP